MSPNKDQRVSYEAFCRGMIRLQKQEDEEKQNQDQFDPEEVSTKIPPPTRTRGRSTSSELSFGRSDERRKSLYNLIISAGRRLSSNSAHGDEVTTTPHADSSASTQSHHMTPPRRGARRASAVFSEMLDREEEDDASLAARVFEQQHVALAAIAGSTGLGIAGLVAQATKTSNAHRGQRETDSQRFGGEVTLEDELDNVRAELQLTQEENKDLRTRRELLLNIGRTMEAELEELYKKHEAMQKDLKDRDALVADLIEDKEKLIEYIKHQHQLSEQKGDASGEDFEWAEAQRRARLGLSSRHSGAGDTESELAARRAREARGRNYAALSLKRARGDSAKVRRLRTKVQQLIDSINGMRSFNARWESGRTLKDELCQVLWAEPAVLARGGTGGVFDRPHPSNELVKLLLQHCIRVQDENLEVDERKHDMQQEKLTQAALGHDQTSRSCQAPKHGEGATQPTQPAQQTQQSRIPHATKLDSTDLKQVVATVTHRTTAPPQSRALCALCKGAGVTGQIVLDARQRLKTDATHATTTCRQCEILNNMEGRSDAFKPGSTLTGGALTSLEECLLLLRHPGLSTSDLVPILRHLTDTYTSQGMAWAQAFCARESMLQLLVARFAEVTDKLLPGQIRGAVSTGPVLLPEERHRMRAAWGVGDLVEINVKQYGWQEARVTAIVPKTGMRRELLDCEATSRDVRRRCHRFDAGTIRPHPNALSPHGGVPARARSAAAKTAKRRKGSRNASGSTNPSQILAVHIQTIRVLDALATHRCTAEPLIAMQSLVLYAVLSLLPCLDGPLASAPDWIAQLRLRSTCRFLTRVCNNTERGWVLIAQAMAWVIALPPARILLNARRRAGRSGRGGSARGLSSGGSRGSSSAFDMREFAGLERWRDGGYKIGKTSRFGVGGIYGRDVVQSARSASSVKGASSPKQSVRKTTAQALAVHKAARAFKSGLSRTRTPSPSVTHRARTPSGDKQTMPSSAPTNPTGASIRSRSPRGNSKSVRKQAKRSLKSDPSIVVSSVAKQSKMTGNTRYHTGSQSKIRTETPKRDRSPARFGFTGVKSKGRSRRGGRSDSMPVISVLVCFNVFPYCTIFFVFIFLFLCLHFPLDFQKDSRFRGKLTKVASASLRSPKTRDKGEDSQPKPQHTAATAESHSNWSASTTTRHGRYSEGSPQRDGNVLFLSTDPLSQTMPSIARGRSSPPSSSRRTAKPIERKRSAPIKKRATTHSTWGTSADDKNRHSAYAVESKSPPNEIPTRDSLEELSDAAKLADGRKHAMLFLKALWRHVSEPDTLIIAARLLYALDSAFQMASARQKALLRRSVEKHDDDTNDGPELHV